MGELSFFAFLYGILYWRTKVKVKQMEANEPANRLRKHHAAVLEMQDRNQAADVLAYIDRELVEGTPCADGFWYLRAWALRQLGELVQARVATERAIALNTAYVEAYELRAEILDALGNTRLAEDCRETVRRFTGRGLVTHLH